MLSLELVVLQILRPEQNCLRSLGPETSLYLPQDSWRGQEGLASDMCHGSQRVPGIRLLLPPGPRQSALQCRGCGA